MASSHGSTSWLRRRMLWLLVAVALPVMLPASIAPVAAETPTPSAGTFEVICTPDTFQPGVWVVTECTTTITNGTQDVAPAGYLSVRTVGGPIPDYFWISNVRDGEYVPVGIGDLSFKGDGLGPGQSSESHLIGLLRMSEGTWRGEDTLFSGDREVATIPVQLAADEGAAAPPQDLLLTKTLVDELTPDGGPASSVTYETKITNQGSTTLFDVTVTDRTEYVDLVKAEPAPVTRNDAVHLVTWDLASFGKDSLAPGESLVLRLTYGPSDESGCSFIHKQRCRRRGVRRRDGGALRHASGRYGGRG
jgi:hypothetical protein